MKRLLFTLLVALALLPAAQAQFNVGADIVSSYVWRGLPANSAANIQPTLSYSYGFEGGSATLGTWGSYSVMDSQFQEIDIYGSVSFGPATLGAVSYTYPVIAAGSGLGLFDGDYHVVELFGSVNGGEAFAGTLFAAVNVLNDDDTSVYIEGSYPFTVEDVTVTSYIGVVPTESAWYLTDGFAVTNLSLKAAKSITITDSFSLPVFSTLTVNPELETYFLVFGVSLF